MAENFDLIFGQSAGSQYAWSESDYQNGWDTVGNTPPTAQQFDALQRRSDLKAQELNNALTPLVNASQTDNRQPSTAYSEGDIKYSPLLPTGWFLSCTVSGTTSASELVVPSPVAEGDEITDGDVTWKAKKIGGAGDAGDGVPLGAIIPLAHNSTLPAGYLECDGSAVSRTMYPDLFSAIGTTYGAGDGSTTFNLPDINQAQRFLQGGTTAGVIKQAGLPNITGYAGAPYCNGGAVPATGAFYSAENNGGAASGGNAYTKVYLDASRSSSVYGNSDTVQPNALTCRYIIKAFDGQTADSALIDITQYAEALNRKVDKADFLDSAETHNAIYRGKDLTEYFNSGLMSTDLANGNFSNIFVGDYITKTVTIDGVTYENVKWIVMHINYHLHEGDTETTQNHVVLMPEERLGTRQMNSSNTTAGGYTGSAMWTAHIPKVVTGIEAAFGADHVLEHRELLTNAMDANQKSSAYYGWSGASSNWLWVSVKVNLANEAMVYGAPTVSSSFFDTGECNTQLAAFKLNHGLICSKRYWWWLRSVAHSTDFCFVDDGGHADDRYASLSAGGVRPYFLLY